MGIAVAMGRRRSAPSANAYPVRMVVSTVGGSNGFVGWLSKPVSWDVDETWCFVEHGREAGAASTGPTCAASAADRARAGVDVADGGLPVFLESGYDRD